MTLPTPPSLKRRVLLWLMVPVLVVMPLLGLGLYRMLHNAAMGWLDQSLGDTALSLVTLIHERNGQLSMDVSPATDNALRFDRRDHVYYLVLDPQGRMLHGDPQLLPLARVDNKLPNGAWHFGLRQLGHESIRLAEVGTGCGQGQLCQVLVAETLHKRDDLKRQLIVSVCMVAVTLSALLAVAGWLAIWRGLSPLQKLRQEIERRDLDRLEPLDAAVPNELGPLISAFNRLFERLRKAAAAQQDFLSTAAHQLRTPLTSLRTEIDLALLEPHDARTEPMLLRLQKSVARSVRLANQMLSMARAEAGLHEQDNQPLDLRDIAAQLAEDWVPRALEFDMDLGFELQSAPACGQSFLLRELLENLLHNCVNYAGHGATVTVRTGVEGDKVFLEVEDSGPGIPEAERQHALERFHRGTSNQAQQTPGSGLGLAIANDIARRHDGRLELCDALSGQGLRVRITLPRYTAPAV